MSNLIEIFGFSYIPVMTIKLSFIAMSWNFVFLIHQAMLKQLWMDTLLTVINVGSYIV